MCVPFRYAYATTSNPAEWAQKAVSVSLNVNVNLYSA